MQKIQSAVSESEDSETGSDSQFLQIPSFCRFPVSASSQFLQIPVPADSQFLHTNEQCCTCEGVMSYIFKSHVILVNVSCHINVDVEGVMSHMNESVTRVNESCQTNGWVMSHRWMSHVTHMNESCHTHEWVHTYEWVMSHTWMSHVRHMSESCHTQNESCHTYEWVMSHTWMSHVKHKNEPCHTHEWVMSHTWMSHVTRMSPFYGVATISRLLKNLGLFCIGAL